MSEEQEWKVDEVSPTEIKLTRFDISRDRSQESSVPFEDRRSREFQPQLHKHGNVEPFSNEQDAKAVASAPRAVFLSSHALNLHAFRNSSRLTRC